MSLVMNYPLYFRSFGDYKQPLFIYSTALVFKILGVSEYNLRLVSFLYFMLFVVGLHLIVSKLFPNNKLIILYALITAGWLPWYFTLSRIAFAVITQLAVITMAIFFILKTYHDPPGKQRVFSAALAGSLLGLSIYTYTTSRLLSFLLLAIMLAVYARKKTLRRSLVIIISFSVLAAPFIFYSFQYPGQLSAYVWLKTYLDDPIPLMDKTTQFAEYYLAYLSPSYLLRFGDAGNLRHHTGYGGQLYISTVILAIVGLFGLIRKTTPHKKFVDYLATCLLLTPIAAAIIAPYLSPHALQSILVGLFILLLSCFGLSSLLKVRHREKIILTTLIFVALIIQSYLYTNHYFTIYPAESIEAFETFSFKTTFAQAIRHKPAQILISDNPRSFYISYLFYKHIVPNPDNIPIIIGPIDSQTDTCVIYFSLFEEPSTDTVIPFKQYAHRSHMAQLRCYY